MMWLKSKLCTALLSVSMMGMLMGTPVQAATSVSGKINSSTCLGSVSYTYAPGGASNGIQAKTIFGNGGTLKVKATVYYKANGKRYTNQASDSSGGGGVSAIATNNDFGNVYGGTGWHYVKSGAYTWENNTKIGTTW